MTRHSSAPPAPDVDAAQRHGLALALAYERWRGRLPGAWRTDAETRVHQAGALRVSAALETLEPEHPGDVEGERHLLVSVSRTDRRPPTPADVAVAQATFCPAGVPVEVQRGGEYRPMVFLTAYVPPGLAWVAAD